MLGSIISPVFKSKISDEEPLKWFMNGLSLIVAYVFAFVEKDISFKFSFCMVFNWKVFIFSNSVKVTGNSNSFPLSGSQKIGPADFTFFFILSWNI